MLGFRVLSGFGAGLAAVTCLAIAGDSASGAAKPPAADPSPSTTEPSVAVQSISHFVATGVDVTRANEEIDAPYQSVLSIEVAGLPEISFPGYPLTVQPH